MDWYVVAVRSREYRRDGLIVREVCTRTGLLLAHTVSVFLGNIMLQNIAVISWFNFTTFDVVTLKVCSTLESSVVVSDNSCTVLT